MIRPRKYVGPPVSCDDYGYGYLPTLPYIRITASRFILCILNKVNCKVDDHITHRIIVIPSSLQLFSFTSIPVRTQTAGQQGQTQTDTYTDTVSYLHPLSISGPSSDHPVRAIRILHRLCLLHMRNSTLRC